MLSFQAAKAQFPALEVDRLTSSLTFSWSADPDNSLNTTVSVLVDGVTTAVSLNGGAAVTSPIETSVFEMDGMIEISNLISGTGYSVEFQALNGAVLYDQVHYTSKFLLIS